MSDKLRGAILRFSLIFFVSFNKKVPVHFSCSGEQRLFHCEAPEMFSGYIMTRFSFLDDPLWSDPPALSICIWQPWIEIQQLTIFLQGCFFWWLTVFTVFLVTPVLDKTIFFSLLKLICQSKNAIVKECFSTMDADSRRRPETVSSHHVWQSCWYTLYHGIWFVMQTRQKKQQKKLPALYLQLYNGH